MIQIILACFVLVRTVFCWPIKGQKQEMFAVSVNGDDEILRDLEVGAVNFLHTTDTHGWLGSHLTQKDYDADWGDFVSFVDLFKKRRLNKGQDLIVVDTGDKEDGNGLSDATFPRAINSTSIFNEVDYDLLTLGNHELYTEEISIQEYAMTAMSDKYRDKYVSSNVEFITDDGTRVPFGNRYVYFETANSKTRILALSFLFDFQRENKRVKVTPAIDVAKDSEWFKDMVIEYPEDSFDILLIFGHIALTDHKNKEINKLHDHLRTLYPNVVIQYFGGHSHIRDFVMLDEKSTGLQSGRFCETVGFLSIDSLTSRTPTFFRRYLDFSKRSFSYHVGLENETELITYKGLQVSKRIDALSKELELSKTYGYVPQNYYFSTEPVNSNRSIYHLLTNSVLPRLTSNATKYDIGRYIMINSGSIRYDLFKGPFTKDTEFIVSPFDNEWEYITIPNKIAAKIESHLNAAKYITALGQPKMMSKSFSSKDTVITKSNCPFVKFPFLTEGYTTSDDFGCEGDDTLHNSQRQYKIPNVVQATERIDQVQDDETVHFVYYNFMKNSILDAINAIIKMSDSKGKIYTDKDVAIYGGESTKMLLREYIHEISS